MKNDSLYDELKTAYTEKNLTTISTRIIEAFRNKNLAFIKQLMQKIDHALDLHENSLNKVFAKLIMLYHPDRLNFYLKEIENSWQKNDEKKFKSLSHILIVLENIDRIPAPSAIEFNSDFASEADYHYVAEEFDHIMTIDDSDDLPIEEPEEYKLTDFISALKQKEYGNLNIQFSHYDLENTEGELELSNAGINDLSGIEYCRNLTVLDLSNNDLVDITSLGHLEILEELYLPENAISIIDSLAFLTRLKKLDIAFNHIEDISPLFDLSGLEYINIVGNKIPKDQIRTLKNKGIVVID